MIKILFFGDIVGKPGRKALAAVLPKLKKQYKPDLVIANAENIAHGIGVTQKTLDECQQAGVDLFTSGNHIWKKPEIYEIFKNPDVPLLRPANYSPDSPGLGHKIVLLGTKQLLVINLNGQVFIEEEFSNPFHTIDQILKQYENTELAGIIVDLHAEATSEKIAFGWYVDGRVTAVIGTHTHIPTADATILPQGTAYITDVGMVGLKSSVIGVDKDIIINNFLENGHKAHDIPDHGSCVINSVLITIDLKNRKANKISLIQRETEV